jgi:VanZ family protein
VTRNTRLRHFWPAFLWMAVIFISTSIPELPALPGDVTDTSLHSSGYALLGALLVRGFAAARWRGVTIRAALLAIAAAAAYGAFDEWHQLYVPGRTADLRDLAADAIGASVAAGAVWAWGIIRRLRRRDDVSTSGGRARGSRRAPYHQSS